MLRASARAFARAPLALACGLPPARVRVPWTGAARLAATCAAPVPPPPASAAPPELTALFDGSCPVCVAEISFLRTFARAPRVAWVDVSAPAFDAAAWSAVAGVAVPIGRAELLAEMHVLDARGGSSSTLRKRVPAFRALYAVVSGRDWLAFTERVPFAALADGAYELARRHKHRLAFLFPRCEPCAR